MKWNKRFRLPGEQMSYRDVVHNIGNIVNNIVIVLYGVRWLLTYHGHHFFRYINVEKLWCTTEMNTVLYGNYILMEIFFKGYINLKYNEVLLHIY